MSNIKTLALEMKQKIPQNKASHFTHIHPTGQKILKRFKIWYNRNFRGIITITQFDPISFEADQLIKKNRPSKIVTKSNYFKRS